MQNMLWGVVRILVVLILLGVMKKAVAKTPLNLGFDGDLKTKIVTLYCIDS